jgi:hypothetical protein
MLTFTVVLQEPWLTACSVGCTSLALTLVIMANKSHPIIISMNDFIGDLNFKKSSVFMFYFLR